MNKRKKTAAGLAWLLGIFLGSIVFMEILSRTSGCSSKRYSESMPACNDQRYTEDASHKMYLDELSKRYSQGVAPSTQELEKAVIEVDRKAIGGANGVYCNGAIFVSNDLPAQAELYVRRHELEHVFQDILNMDLENHESAANYAAAKEYPLGMVQTAIVSVIKARSRFDSITCYLVALWETFKIYFLP
jgi:hypothetical protein